MPLRVLGLDPALANTGWAVVDVDETPEFRAEPPAWGEGRGVPTFRAMTLVARGTFSTAPGVPIFARLSETCRRVLETAAVWRPALVASEGVLLAGTQRNMGGMGLAALLWDRFGPDLPGVPPDPRAESARGVVLIDPARVQWLAHGERSTKAAAVKERYRLVARDPAEPPGKKAKRRGEAGLTEHEADAWFIACYGSRFWKTCVERSWPDEILSATEREFYRTATKGRKGEEKPTGLLAREGHSWWRRGAAEGARAA